MSDPSRLDRKVALITGSSRGIGLAVAEEMARAGARGLVLVARNAEALEEARATIEGVGAECLAVAADVTSEEDVERMVAAARDRFGEVDILVNNAGAAPLRGQLKDMRPVGLGQMIGLHLVRAYLTWVAV